jgi:two-component system sensor histidine kinase SenX3
VTRHLVPMGAVVALAVTTAVVQGWVVGLVVGLVGSLFVAWLQQRRMQREVAQLTRSVAGWDDPGRPRSVVTHGLEELRGLGEVLDRAGESLDRSVARMQADLPWRRELVHALPSAAVLFGGDGYLVAANDAARGLLGVPADGERTTMLAALGNAQLAGAVRRTSAATGMATVDAEITGRLVRANIVAVGDQRLVLVSDRTRERRVEDVRRNFVVNASHELKTPATAIQALAEALVVTARTDPARIPALVERLEHESQRLIRLVHDLLDLRRLEEAMEVGREVVDLVDVVAQVVDDVAGWARDRDVVVTVELPGTACVLVDAEDLHLVVRNLVANALQYNRPGGTVALTVTTDQHGQVVLEVADTGIGVPKADLDRIFERFYRVDVGRSRATGGTGLGLSMVRHAVNRNGGSIEVESLLGTGSVFRVRLPSGMAVPPASRPDVAHDVASAT